ncbi:zinc finger BED domain-containing protein RICESLEEPER 2-like [Dorcoceras hygrometricum]|uniref:Zinc finger BED domain-containing protein RICESLEEPER 2-like n=1 Tax=Dorcoceras hygrometricum TaxID=472368 RepID=A0A2Z7BHY6_9LAMI|nr:zinc finger BED domain-containing protein RICESLEEPER 2-like [Dorcoceras hygrometricum]
MEQMKEAAATRILMHDHPFSTVEEGGFNIFCRSGMSQWTSISRATLKKHCFMIYELERKMSCLLKAAKHISLITDLWKSKNKKIEYMVVSQISDEILKCARDWEIENQIFTVTVDNASVNDVVIRNLLNDLLRIKIILFVIDDCTTRWNSTYEIFQITLSFKEVFPRFKDQETSYIDCPIEEQWKKLEKVFSI